MRAMLYQEVSMLLSRHICGKALILALGLTLSATHANADYFLARNGGELIITNTRKPNTSKEKIRATRTLAPNVASGCLRGDAVASIGLV